MSFTVTLLSLPPVAIGTDPSGSMAIAILNAATSGGGSGGGGGATAFLGLTDTPSAYTGQGGKAVRVNAGGSALEFFDAFAGAFADLTGKPTTLAGYGITDAATAAGLTSLTATVAGQGVLIDDLDTELGVAETALAAHIAATTAHGITAFGSSLVSSVDAAAARTVLGLGTAALAATGDFEPAGTAASAVGTHAALTSNVHGISTFAATLLDDTSASAMRTTIAAAGSTEFTNHTGGLTVHGRSSFVASIVGSANAAAFRTAIGAAGVATTLAGYGITDAASATIALGEIPLSIDGQGAATAAIDRRRRIERACVITSASIAADVAGSVSITFKRDRGGSVTTLGTIALSAAQDVRDTTLSGWTIDLAAGDILIAECGAGTTLTAFTVTLGRRAA